MHVLLPDRMQFVPERESAGDDESDEKADQKEPAISRQRDQQNRNDSDSDNETRRSPAAKSKPAAKFRLHEFILARLLGLALGRVAAAIRAGRRSSCEEI
jgi:hypothetical protein